MKSSIVIAALSIMLIGGVAAVPSYAQVLDAITISTDKESYSAGETVTVNGNIRQTMQGAVALTVLAPNGNRINVDQLTPDDAGAFSTTFVAGGPQWMTAGQYEIVVSYGVVAANIVTNTATIEYTGGVAAPAPDPEPPADDPLAGITSSITGGTITSIRIGDDEAAVVVIIDAIDDGELTLNIPRDIFESKSDGQSGDDIPFIVLVDSAEANAIETSGAGVRTLTIPFTAGTDVIEIFGSWIIPEFGIIAIGILAVAIVAIIVASSRSSVSILPRY